MATSYLTAAPEQPAPGVPDAHIAPLTAPRLSPALVKGRRIFVECPSWCTVDHVAAPENFVEDVWHAGDYTDLKVPRMNRTPDLFAFARLGFDPETDDTFIHVDDHSEGFHLSPEQAEQFADNLAGFAEAIRAMAKTAKGGA